MKKGLFLVFFTAVISGISVFTNKLIVSTTDPIVFTAMRNVLVFAFLCTILVKSGNLRRIRRIGIRDLALLLIIGVSGGGMAFALFFTGLSEFPAVGGNLIHKTLFLWVALLAYPLLGEKPEKSTYLGYALIILATFVLSRPAGFSITPHAFMILSATIIWAFENVLAKKVLTHVPHEIVGTARILFGLPVLFTVALLQGKGVAFVLPSSYNLAALLVSAVLLTGYIWTWYQGLRRVPATVATGVLVIAPVVTALLSAGFVDRAIPESQIVPMILLTAGVALIAGRITGKPGAAEGV